MTQQVREAQDILAEAIKANRQVNALSSVLQVVDRGLSGVGDLRVQVQNLGTTIAKTDGKTVYINRKRVAEVFTTQPLDQAIRTFKGTNLHELAHVIFTPRSGDAISTWVQQNRRFKWAWNALEDQRIETLFTALYPATTGYFQNSTHTWLLANPDPSTLYRAYTLVGGRRYLDRKVRLAARAAFLAHYGSQAADECDRIVQEYVALPLPGGTERAKVLVEEFYNLLRDTTGQERQALEGSGRCGNSGAAEEGEIDPERVVEAARRVREDQEREAQEDDQDGPEDHEAGDGAAYPEDIIEDDSEPRDGASGEDYPVDDEDDAPGTGDNPFDSEDDEDGDQGAGAGEGEEGDEDGDQNGTGQGESDQSDTDLDDSGEGGSRGDEDNRSTPPEADPIKDLEDAIIDAQADVLTDEDLKKDLERTLEAFKAHMGAKRDNEDHDIYANHSPVQASPEAVRAVAKVVAQLRRIQRANEPGRIRQQMHGKVNVRRAIQNAVDPTVFDIFDQWDEGVEEAASTEVVIALDLSGSMDRILPQASEALWVLKKAFDKSGIRTTVFGFSDGNTTLYPGDERIQGTTVRCFGDWGCTDANPTHHAAYRVLTTSKAANKVLVTITDGGWQDFEGDGKDAENVVAALRQAGTHTLLFGCNGHYVSNDTHGYEHTGDLKSITDIVGIVGGLVKGIQAAARRGA